MRVFILSLFILIATGCSTTYSNQSITGKIFPLVEGQSLEEKMVTIPSDFSGDYALLLVGYKQDSQFDIDRWLIGLDMTKTKVNAYEIPTIQGLFPRMFSTYIDNGMRKGIPKPLWKGVITIYDDGEKILKFTGNENPNNARAILIDEKGVVQYFHDEGFSVNALNKLRATLNNQ